MNEFVEFEELSWCAGELWIFAKDHYDCVHFAIIY